MTRPHGTVPRRVPSSALTSGEVAALRELFDAAWGSPTDPFTDEDWGHTLGGLHFIVADRGEIVAHASVLQRELHTGGHPLATGYVEAVATSPAHQRRGYGSALMRDATDYIDQTFQLGALSTGIPAFFERFGWLAWMGPTFVRTTSGPIRTPEEDGNILVRLTPTSPELDLAAPISCDWRPGDVW